MTRMLVMVRTIEEAEAAVAAGADRLVFVAADTVPLAAMAAAVGGRCPVAIWVEAAPWRPRREACGADQVYGAAALLGQTDAGIEAVATLPGLEAAFEPVAGAGFAGVVLGADAASERLLRRVAPAQLQRRIEAARACGLSVALAGPMEPPDVPRLLALAPDALLLDGAVRRNGRAGAPLDPARLALLRDLMPRPDTAEPVEVVALGPDLIAVRDWTVAIHVGAYSHETAPQRVRFTVEAELAPRAGPAGGLRDVVSYDLITDAIARATTTHVDLVETLAEDVARSVLGHPRVRAVEVAVEKLDLGPGRVGCRIRRGRRGAA